MTSQAIAYYMQHRNIWVIWDRSENPTLNKIEDKNYQLWRGNDLGIDVDLFIQGFDEYNNQSESEEVVLTEQIKESVSEDTETTEQSDNQ